MHYLYNLLYDLDFHEIEYRLKRPCDDAIAIYIKLKGQRVDVWIMENEEVWVSVYRGTEHVAISESSVLELINRLRESESE